MNPASITRLAEFDTPTVANGIELLDVQDPSSGFTGPDIRALTPESGVRVGVVVTARLDTTSPGVDQPESLFLEWLRLINAAARGDGRETWPVFAVMEAVGPRPRHTVTIGGGMATLMKLAGATGFITNGCIRDIEEVRQAPLACWGAGLAPMHGRLRWLDVNSPVVIDGMTIRPGDVIHADINGAIVFPGQAVDQLYARAQEVHEREQGLFDKLRAPGMTLETYLKSRT